MSPIRGGFDGTCAAEWSALHSELGRVPPKTG